MEPTSIVVMAGAAFKLIDTLVDALRNGDDPSTPEQVDAAVASMNAAVNKLGDLATELKAKKDAEDDDTRDEA